MPTDIDIFFSPLNYDFKYIQREEIEDTHGTENLLAFVNQAYGKAQKALQHIVGDDSEFKILATRK